MNHTAQNSAGGASSHSLQYKTFRAYSVKTLDEKQGIIEAIVSVFTNIDRGDERVLAGFFTASLEKKLPKGVWMHDWTVPVAKTLEARELAPGDPLLPAELKELGGLYIKGQFNLNTQRGSEAFSDIDFGIIDEYSIGYEVTKSKYNAATGVLDLMEGELFEWSPVLVGMNPLTATISAKDARAKESATMQDNNKTPAAGVEVKSDYLGTYTEGEMTMEAISVLCYRLMYFALYDALYTEDTPLEERLQIVEGALGEFRDLALRTVTGIMKNDAGAQSIEAAQKSLRALWPDPNEKTLDLLNSPAGLKFFQRTDAALAAVSKVKTDAKGIHDLRVKEGRTLSDANRSRLQQICEAMKSASGDLDTILAETDPQASAKAARAVRVKMLDHEQFLADLEV